jgi:hypothetical protein
MVLLNLFDRGTFLERSNFAPFLSHGAKKEIKQMLKYANKLDLESKKE